MKNFFSPGVRLVFVLTILLVALYLFSDMFTKVPFEIFTAVLALFFVVNTAIARVVDTKLAGKSKPLQ